MPLSLSLSGSLSSSSAPASQVCTSAAWSVPTDEISRDPSALQVYTAPVDRVRATRSTTIARPSGLAGAAITGRASFRCCDEQLFDLYYDAAQNVWVLDVAHDYK